MKLGIMQGRLVPPEGGRYQSFPRTRWRDEFALASSAGLDTIEWIYDAYGEDVNPLSMDTGVDELGRLCATHAVRIESVCADWFMDFPLVGTHAAAAADRWSRLRWLMRQGATLGINRVVLPFVDASAIRGPDDVAAITRGVKSLFNLIDATGVELHLETALDPGSFAALLEGVGHPGVSVNYDSGNSAALGFRPQDEFAAYGSRVGSVHLKDRRLGAGTVPLGEGNTDFPGLFGALRAAGYDGDFILQVARGAEGDELAWTRGNVATARKWLNSLGQT